LLREINIVGKEHPSAGPPTRRVGAVFFTSSLRSSGKRNSRRAVARKGGPVRWGPLAAVRFCPAARAGDDLRKRLLGAGRFAHRARRNIISGFHFEKHRAGRRTGQNRYEVVSFGCIEMGGEHFQPGIWGGIDIAEKKSRIKRKPGQTRAVKKKPGLLLIEKKFPFCVSDGRWEGRRANRLGGHLESEASSGRGAFR